MPAYPRPDADPEEAAHEEAAHEAAAHEAAAWAKAFSGADALTAPERATLRDLMLRAKETGRDDLLDRLAAFAADPAGFRAFVTEAGGA
jgi:hypothetical protein